jgi:flagellar biosynthesis/type III secretory pathway protein FliH
MGTEGNSQSLPILDEQQEEGLMETKPLWFREECNECGEEGLSTRAEPVPADEMYECNDCLVYKHGYRDGFKDGLKDGREEVEVLQEKVRDLKTLLELFLKSFQPS